MTEILHVFAESQRIGHIEWDRSRDRLSFHYDDAWRVTPTAFPLSLSMPLTTAVHSHAVVLPFLWGLLPDNDEVLGRWGARFHVSPRNPFKLLSHVGEDCAGGIQLITEQRIGEWSGARRGGRVTWLDDDEIAARMALLLKDHSAVRTGTDRGHFSLAGAQPKTALYYDAKGRRWGVPSGSVPTTHIFKPATGAYDGYAENEHFCMSLARALNLAVASSTVQYFGSAPVIIIERFDRLRTGGKVLRIHQEDMCQALARMPHNKYQNQGGPSAAEITALIRQHSSARASDEARFIDALILNWLLAGTDAHAKNYAFLIASSGTVRLAPLYDLSSALPYPLQVPPRRAKLAMKIGGKYELRYITSREWKKFATELRLDADKLRDRTIELASILPDTAATVQRTLKAQGIRHGVIARLVKAISTRMPECRAIWK